MNNDNIFEILSIAGSPNGPAQEKYARFREKLENTLQPTVPAKDLAGLVICAALEVEFGEAFTKSPFSAKMVNTIAESILANTELRGQMMAVVTTIHGAQQNQKKNPFSFPQHDKN